MEKIAWHYIPDNYNLSSCSPPNKIIVNIWLECCDQDITGERMVLGWLPVPHWSNVFLTGCTPEVRVPVCCSWAHDFSLSSLVVIFLVMQCLLNRVLFKIFGAYKIPDSKKMEIFLKLTKVRLWGVL
jgi:hypothetical protein